MAKLGPMLRAALTGAGLWAALAAPAGAAEPAAQPDTVRIDTGLLHGASDNGIVSFKNIPYAAPPVGPLRWRAPAAAAAWSGVRDATQYGNDCMQNRMSWDKTASTQPMNEDCLYLNLWAPAAAKKLPVLVWIHGGGFVAGSSTARVTDGSRLAARGAVVVGFNYRLGRFGFFAHPSLSAEAHEGPLGNYGFMDQIAALQWIQRNIAAFGGDPGNVTIYGESAGGESVNILMLAPQARGLFHKAIVSSGGGRAQWPQLHGEGTPLSAEALGQAFAAKAGVKDGGADALRALPASKVLGGINMLDQEKAIYSGPMIDGSIVTSDVASGFAAGKQAPVPYIVGANSNELGFLPSFFLGPIIKENLPRLGGDADKVKAAYPSKDDFNTYFANDFTFVEPAHFLAGAAAASGKPAYLYRFSYVTASKRKSLKGAPHATDVPYVFGNLAATGDEISDADRAASQLIGDYWIAFAATGTPSAPGHAAWPPYTAADDQLLDFTADGSTAAAPAGTPALAAIASHFSGAPAAAPAAAAAAAAQPAAAADLACAALQDFKMEQVHIDSAQPMAATDTLDLGIKGVPPVPVGADICRVRATLTPTPSSEIRIEVWLPPAAQWNGKFIGAGNGGYAGTFTSPYVFMRGAIAKGYAAAGTDTGHQADPAAGEEGADWAMGQPEKLKDYAYRANHVNALAAKALIQAYYGRAQQYSVFEGCSDGGREALAVAARFPEDYEGIIAGAPAAQWTKLMGQFAWNARATGASEEARIPAGKLKVLQDAVMKKCDALDGVKDGLLEDPRRCKFDPAVVQCKAGDHEDCLTPAQVATARKIYAGPRDARGKSLGPGFPPGAEAVQWNQWITGPTAEQRFFSTEYFRYIVFGQPEWTLEQMDFDKDLATAREKTADVLDSSPDLSPYIKRGGKLIIYHGWDDSAIPPENSIDFYQQIRARVGPPADGSVRLYMVPGLAHCLGGPGPNQFDMLGQLTGWIETGKAPQDIEAIKYADDYATFFGLPPGEPVRTRPLCPYPKTAHWTGKGSSDKAGNFVCKAP